MNEQIQRHKHKKKLNGLTEIMKIDNMKVSLQKTWTLTPTDTLDHDTNISISKVCI